jgi:DNA mismatch repair protein MutS
MFATHYHELTILEDEIEGVKNYNISAKKRGDEIIFLRKIVSGGADDSYGIEVAGLAGLPDSVIKRAKTVMKALEDDDNLFNERKNKKKTGQKQNESGQLSLTDITGNEIVSTLTSTDLNTLTPLEALSLLYEMKKKL